VEQPALYTAGVRREFPTDRPGALATTVRRGNPR